LDAGINLLHATAWLVALCVGGVQMPCRSHGQTSPGQSAAPDQGIGNSTSTKLNYEQLVQRAKPLTSARPQDALFLCKRAVQQEPSRYEAHVIAAAAFRKQKEYHQTAVHLQIAMALAPEAKKPIVGRALTEMKVASLPTESRRKLDAVMLILDDAQGAKTGDDRQRFLRDFLIRSTAFIEESSFVADLWLLRTQAAIELDYPEVGWAGANRLRALGTLRRDEPVLRQTMAQLERNGWLGMAVPKRSLRPTLAQARSRAQGGDGYLQTALGELYRTGNKELGIEADCA
jgi:hypothetical protein